MMAAGEAPPGDLRDAPEDRRSRYPIVVRRESIVVMNEHSGKEEQRDVLVVEDSGIGMGREVIQKFLLQVGRSWYESPEFKRRFTFTPTSQFGLGFLSVFGVSRHVEVETHRPDSGDGPLRLVLQGPRNYLLVEKGELELGTRVSVHLDHPVGGSSIVEMVSSWCRRAEFPIVVSDGQNAVTIRAEDPTQFLTSQRDPQDPDLTYKVLCFPFKQPGVDGELYVLARAEGGRELWDMRFFAAEERSKRFPMGQVPLPPPRLICLNGLAVVTDRDRYRATDCYRVDCRSSRFRPTLSRRSLKKGLGWESPLDLVIADQWASVLGQHLAEVTFESTDDLWRYHQRLAQQFEGPVRSNVKLQEFWSGVDSTIPRCELGHLRPCSLDAIQRVPDLWFIVRPSSYLRAEADRTLGRLLDAPYICWEDSTKLCESHATQLFRSRRITQIRRLGESVYAVRWSNGEESHLPFERATAGRLVASCHRFALPNDLLFGVKIRATRLYYNWIVLNSRHPLASWCIAATQREWSEDDKPLGSEAGSRLKTAIVRVFLDGEWAEFNRFIDAWSSAPDISPDLIPPVARLSQESIASENRFDWC